MSELSNEEYLSSILLTIKKMLGPVQSYTAFDIDIIIHINSALMTLTQLGVGPTTGFKITGASETWDQFLPSDQLLESVKLYIYYTVRLGFDPPQSSFALESMRKEAEKLEWRINVAAETPLPEKM